MIPPPPLPQRVLVSRDGQDLGSHSIQEIRDALQRGTILASDRAWYEGTANWMTLAELPGLNSKPEASPKVRGFWRVTGLFLIVFAVGLAAQVLTGIVYGSFVQFRHPGENRSGFLKDINTNGLVLSLGVCASTAATLIACWHCVSRKHGVPPRGFLGLVPFRVKDLGLWAAIFLVVWFGLPSLLQSLGLPMKSDFMHKSYRTAGSLVLYWSAFVLLAPVSEELVFRGYLIKSITTSTALGAPWAVVISSALWAGIHVQYGLGINLYLFGLGLVLGFSRVESGSVYLPVTFHVFLNLVAVSITAFTSKAAL